MIPIQSQQVRGSDLAALSLGDLFAAAKAAETKNALDTGPALTRRAVWSTRFLTTASPLLDLSTTLTAEQAVSRLSAFIEDLARAFADISPPMIEAYREARNAAGQLRHLRGWCRAQIEIAVIERLCSRPIPGVPAGINFDALAGVMNCLTLEQNNDLVFRDRMIRLSEQLVENIRRVDRYRTDPEFLSTDIFEGFRLLVKLDSNRRTEPVVTAVHFSAGSCVAEIHQESFAMLKDRGEPISALYVTGTPLIFVSDAAKLNYRLVEHETRHLLVEGVAKEEPGDPVGAHRILSSIQRRGRARATALASVDPEGALLMEHLCNEVRERNNHDIFVDCCWQEVFTELRLILSQLRECRSSAYSWYSVNNDWTTLGSFDRMERTFRHVLLGIVHQSPVASELTDFQQRFSSSIRGIKNRLVFAAAGAKLLGSGAEAIFEAAPLFLNLSEIERVWDVYADLFPSHDVPTVRQQVNSRRLEWQVLGLGGYVNVSE